MYVASKSGYGSTSKRGRTIGTRLHPGKLFGTTPVQLVAGGTKCAVNFICIQLKEANMLPTNERPPTAEEKQIKRDANGWKRSHQSLLARGPVGGILLYRTLPPPTYEIWLGNIKHRNILGTPSADDSVKSPSRPRPLLSNVRHTERNEVSSSLVP